MGCTQCNNPSRSCSAAVTGRSDKKRIFNTLIISNVMVTINNFNSNEKTLKIAAPPMEAGIHNAKIVDNLQAKLVTKKSDGSKLQIIEVPCEFEGKKFTATLLSEDATQFSQRINIGDAVVVSVEKNQQGYKTATI